MDKGAIELEDITKNPYIIFLSPSIIISIRNMLEFLYRYYLTNTSSQNIISFTI